MSQFKCSHLFLKGFISNQSQLLMIQISSREKAKPHLHPRGVPRFEIWWGEVVIHIGRVSGHPSNLFPTILSSREGSDFFGAGTRMEATLEPGWVSPGRILPSLGLKRCWYGMGWNVGTRRGPPGAIQELRVAEAFRQAPGPPFRMLVFPYRVQSVTEGSSLTSLFKPWWDQGFSYGRPHPPRWGSSTAASWEPAAFFLPLPPIKRPVSCKKKTVPKVESGSVYYRLYDRLIK